MSAKVLSLLLLIFMSSSPTADIRPFIETPNIVKSNIEINHEMEASPFVWNDKLYFLQTMRETVSQIRIDIIDFTTKQAVTTAVYGGYGLSSAAVINGTLYITAAKDWGTSGNDLYLISSTDMKTFSQPRAIKNAGVNGKIFNSSITYNPVTEETIIAYEVDEPGLVPFSTRFLKSKDMVNWTPFGEVFGSDTYNACPTIRFVNGMYYMWTLVYENGIYYTKSHRSKDLLTWESSVIPFLYPTEQEGINNSDMDLVEYKGQTYVFYANSDQQTYSRQTYGVYDGSMRDLLENLIWIKIPSNQKGNIVSKGDFEEYTGTNGVADGWIKWASPGSTDNLQSSTMSTMGSKSQMISAHMTTTTGSAGIYQDITVNPKENYILSSDVKLDILSDSKIVMSIDFYDANYTYISSGLSKVTLKSGYKTYSTVGRVPINAATARVSIYAAATSKNADSTVYIDNVNVRYFD